MTQNLLYKILWFVSAALLVQFAEQTLKASDIPQEGLVLHLDAGSLVGLADGAALSGGWQDLSDATISAMSETPPTFLADAGGGYPAVRFNGVDQYLDVGVTTGEGVSIFIVFAHQRPSLPLNYRDILVTAPDTQLSLASSRAVASAADYPSFNATAGDVYQVKTWLNGHDTASVTGDLFSGRFYLGSAVYSQVQPSNLLRIGSRGTGGFNAGRNDIRELIVYNRALGDEERERVQYALGRKYDMEVVWRSLADEVESWPHVLGSQQFGTQYSFGESGIRTLDYARATIRQGNRVVKFRLSGKYANTDGFTPVASINTLVELVRDQPEVKTILELPCTDYIFWVSSFSIPSWQNQLDENGLKATAESKIYAEVYDLAAYLLSTYSGTGKRFYLGNWEGDWMLSGDFRNDPRTIPANRIQGMIDWANIRQQAIDDAKAATPHSDVEVWFYLEMNKADWMREGLPCVANSVIPAMPKLDMISISSYSLHKDNGAQAPRSRIHSDLDQVQALIDAKPDSSIAGSRIMIGEYGWIYTPSNYSSLEDFADAHRITARNYVSWQGGTLRFILMWQFFNEATLDNGNSKQMSQIGPDNDLRPLYYLHENFYRLMRRWVDDYRERTGSLPDPRAYADQANHVLGFVSLRDYNPVLSFSTYNAWKTYNFRDAVEANDVTVSGPFSDPYGSGISNLERYALGLNKFEYNASFFPRMRLVSDLPVFAFRYDPVKADLRWQVQVTSTLIEWDRVVFDSNIDQAAPVDGWLHVDAVESADESRSLFYRLLLQLQ